MHVSGILCPGREVVQCGSLQKKLSIINGLLLRSYSTLTVYSVPVETMDAGFHRSAQVEQLTVPDGTKSTGTWHLHQREWR